jgi:hypothetical protein
MYYGNANCYQKVLDYIVICLDVLLWQLIYLLGALQIISDWAAEI